MAQVEEVCMHVCTYVCCTCPISGYGREREREVRLAAEP